MVRRREGTKRFVNALLSDIAATFAEGSDIALMVDPCVDRLVTTDLTGLTFETALSRLAELAVAAYRLKNGLHRIEPKEADQFEDGVDWLPMISDGPNEPIESRYHWMLDRIAQGQGPELRRWMGPNIDAGSLIATMRAFPRVMPVYFAYVGQDVEAIVAHRDGNDKERRFRDLWRWNGSEWKWLSRRAVAPNEGLRFYDASVAGVLTAFFARHRQAVVLKPSIRGRVTVYLDGYDFRSGLSKLLRAANLTYRIVDGRYVIGPVR